MVDDQHPAHAHLEVYDTKDGLWHPELGDLTQPDDWDFLPAGDAFVTRRVKAAGDYWMLYQPRGRRAHRRMLGLLAPSNAIAAARTAADDTLSRRQTQRVAGACQRDNKEAAYRVGFERAVLAWLDFASDHTAVARDVARNAVDRATVVGSGRVGRTKTVGLEDRAALAARAYIRHHYTEYEQQLMAVDLVDFDDDDFSFDSAGDYREIKRAAHQAVDDFLQRHRTPRN